MRRYSDRQYCYGMRSSGHCAMLRSRLPLPYPFRAADRFWGAVTQGGGYALHSVVTLVARGCYAQPFQGTFHPGLYLARDASRIIRIMI